MKKLLLTLVLTLGVTGLMGCSLPKEITDTVDNTIAGATDTVTDTATDTVTDTITDPIAYNDSIIDIQTKALDAYNEYDTLVQETPLGWDFTVVETKRAETLKTIQDLQSTLWKMGGYQGDTDLRDAFVINLTSLTNSLENEEKELIKLYISRGKIEGDLPEEEVNKEKALLDKISARDQAAYTAIIKVQEAFADKYGYELENNEEVTTGDTIIPKK